MLGGMTTSITVHFNVTKEDITKVSAGLICSKLLPLSSTEREKKESHTCLGKTGRFQFPPAPLKSSGDNLG